LEPQDLLAFFGAAEVNQFTLSREDDPLIRASADVRVINSVANFIRLHNCREILLALPWGDAGRLEFVRDQIKTLPVAARLLPDMRVRSLTNYTSSARQRVLAIEIQRAPLSAAERFVKRVMDILWLPWLWYFSCPSWLSLRLRDDAKAGLYCVKWRQDG
jgi:undecaprenyl-phosphate galactose phosphotransferase/putative colanic acid biosynthesis UDP-glucose lipid carrier transferase